MIRSQEELENYIADQVKKYKGISMPQKAGMLERMNHKTLPCERLHPNPADEFCLPEVGPSYRIIGEYEKKIRRSLIYDDYDPFGEPVLVEKMSPDGYLILNGHHRWAAALRCGLKEVPVKIVNLTQDSDIQKIIESSKHDRRITLDLDELVFDSSDETLLAKKLPFPHCLFYKERIRLGVPTFLHFLVMEGYDIWVYTASYYSYDYLQHLFRLYRIHVDGVITGTGRKVEKTEENKKKNEAIRNLFRENYKETITIDYKGIVRSFTSGRDLEQYDLDCPPAEWAREVLNILECIVKDNKDE